MKEPLKFNPKVGDPVYARHYSYLRPLEKNGQSVDGKVIQSGRIYCHVDFGNGPVRFHKKNGQTSGSTIHRYVLYPSQQARDESFEREELEKLVWHLDAKPLTLPQLRAIAAVIVNK